MSESEMVYSYEPTENDAILADPLPLVYILKESFLIKDEKI